MTKALNQQLQQLQNAAQAQTTTYDTSRQQLYENFVDTYLWWRDAEQKKGYLSSVLKSAGIKTRTRGINAPNFYAVIRLVWNINTSKRASAVSNWARSMAGLHEEYGNNTSLYATNPRVELLNYIHNSNGLGALRGEREMSQQELDEEEATGVTVTRGRPTASAPNSASVLDSKKQKAKTAPAAATVQAFPTAIANRDGLIVMVGRKAQNGDIEIIGSDYSDSTVAHALDACARIDRTTVTPSLRLIAEALEPQALPKKLEKRRKHYFDDTEEMVLVDQNGRKEKIKRTTTLRIRPQHGDIVVAKAPNTVGVVTYAIPKIEFTVQKEVTLRGADRYWIEKQLLGEEKISLFQADPTHSLDEDKTTRDADYFLKLSTSNSKYNRNLYFYDVAKSVVPDTISQPNIVDRTDLKFDWELTATQQWLAELDALCMTLWINRIGGQYNKPANAWVGFEFKKDRLELKAWWDDEEKKFQQSYPVLYANNARLNAKDDATFACKPKDAVPLFSTLPLLPITTDVVIRANRHVMEVNYETDIASYAHYIPPANEKGEQDGAAFEQRETKLDSEAEA